MSYQVRPLKHALFAANPESSAMRKLGDSLRTLPRLPLKLANVVCEIGAVSR